MCGICGIYNFNNLEVLDKDIHSMNAEMHLRGPDDSGLYIRNNIGMGMTRLAIIDVKLGHQPMLSKDGEIVLVFNGEIYNYVELKRDLEKIGYQFFTNSDTEVIIFLYKEYGEEFISKLNGMFTISLFEKKKNKFLIIRDRIGIKPLFYLLNDKKLIFASSIKSIKKISYDFTISEKNFLLFLTLNYIPNSDSIYNNIKKLKPGYYIKIENNKVKFVNYWSLPKFKKNINELEFERILENLITDSIKIQSRSDVEVGSMLSGGLDSSVITTLFAKNVKNKIKTFCVDFTGKKLNENDDAEKVSRSISSDHFYKKIDSSLFFSSLKKITNLLDEPVSDNAIVPSFIISEMAQANNTKVILSGAGADEIFGGYSRYYQTFKSIFFGILRLDNNFSRKISKLIPTHLRNNFYKLNNESIAYTNNTSGVNISYLFELLKNNKTLENQIIAEIEMIFNPFINNNTASYKENLMRADLANYLPDNILSVLDKTTMMHSIEGRVPYLDHRIIEHVFSYNSKVFSEKKFSNAKSIIKKIFNKQIPKKIIKKNKIGFNAPLNNWYKENYNYFKSNFSNSNFYDHFFKKNFNSDISLSKKGNEGLVFNLNIFDEWLKHNHG